MRKLIILCIAILITYSGYSQENADTISNNDNNSWSATDTKFIVDNFFSVKKDSYRRDRGFNLDAPFFDLGYNKVRNSENSFPKLNSSKSINFAVYPLVGSIYLHNRVDIITGIGFEWFNYRFANGMTIFEDEEGITRKEQAWRVFNLDENSFIKKSKLTASYINIPVMVKWYLPTSKSVKRSIYVMGGAIFGFNLGSHTKIKYKNENGNVHKDKLKEDFNLSGFKYGFTVRMYYRAIGIYYNYYASPLFQKDKGPKTYPFTVGLSINLHG